MGLITPKRLKENEAFMWELADRVLDSFLTGGRGEFIGEFAAPFSLFVTADLLGAPEEDRGEFAAVLGRRGAPLARAEARVCIERLLDRTTEIRIAEDKHGPAEDRHYQYVPTFILRGLTELHVEVTL
jgi:cytochrome P450